MQLRMTLGSTLFFCKICLLIICDTLGLYTTKIVTNTGSLFLLNGFSVSSDFFTLPSSISARSCEENMF